MSKGTTHRTVRVDDDLWLPAKAKADAEGVNLSEVIRAALRAYVEGDSDLARWKLDALAQWSAAMLDESYYPQYGRDVAAILQVSSLAEAREIDDMGD